jgi:hypothetical protein
LIRVDLAGPPQRRRALAEFHVRNGEDVEIPAEIYRDGGRLRICIHPRSEGQGWDYPLGEFVSAIGKGITIIDDHYARLWEEGDY